MKRIALSALLLTMSGLSQAGNLIVASPSNVVFGGYNGQPATITGVEASGLFGSLFATSGGTISVTYLGNESYFKDSFSLTGGATLNENNALGDTITKSISAGTVGFKFADNQGFSFSNGQVQTPVIGFVIMSAQTNMYGSFEYILGFNDSSSGDADYDDYVVGINFSPVPEPESYAMLLAGLAGLGAVARRRKYA